jgi:hypothetical protein
MILKVIFGGYFISTGKIHEFFFQREIVGGAGL